MRSQRFEALTRIGPERVSRTGRIAQVRRDEHGADGMRGRERNGLRHGRGRAEGRRSGAPASGQRWRDARAAALVRGRNLPPSLWPDTSLPAQLVGLPLALLLLLGVEASPSPINTTPRFKRLAGVTCVGARRAKAVPAVQEPTSRSLVFVPHCSSTLAHPPTTEPDALSLGLEAPRGGGARLRKGSRDRARARAHAAAGGGAAQRRQRARRGRDQRLNRAGRAARK